MSRLFDKRMRLAVVQTSAVPSLVRQLSSITDCGFRVFGGIAFVSRGNFPHRGPYEDFAKSWALFAITGSLWMLRRESRAPSIMTT